MNRICMNKLNRLAALAIALGSAGVALAQSDATAPSAGPSVPVPLSISWIGAVLLGLMWLAIAAIVLGPLVRFFTPNPPAEPKNLPLSY